MIKLYKLYIKFEKRAEDKVRGRAKRRYSPSWRQKQVARQAAAHRDMLLFLSYIDYICVVNISALFHCINIHSGCVQWCKKNLAHKMLATKFSKHHRQHYIMK
ncbi:Hypothetical_protein [Hexamita inflata]|uniref:Hypothetical_protein n=1 Tax=Hexamita inflata TaxID=28002 RepID=A0AA86TRK6_9EUKA|nr:Hypothetical protein HINF_LOCUS13335 [Hexamita inflata]